MPASAGPLSIVMPMPSLRAEYQESRAALCVGWHLRAAQRILDRTFDYVDAGEPDPSLREIRALRPPKPVWVDLARSYALDPRREGSAR